VKSAFGRAHRAFQEERGRAGVGGSCRRSTEEGRTEGRPPGSHQPGYARDPAGGKTRSADARPVRPRDAASPDAEVGFKEAGPGPRGSRLLLGDKDATGGENLRHAARARHARRSWCRRSFGDEFRRRAPSTVAKDESVVSIAPKVDSLEIVTKDQRLAFARAGLEGWRLGTRPGRRPGRSGPVGGRAVGSPADGSDDSPSGRAGGWPRHDYAKIPARQSPN